MEIWLIENNIVSLQTKIDWIDIGNKNHTYGPVGEHHALFRHFLRLALVYYIGQAMQRYWTALKRSVV